MKKQSVELWVGLFVLAGLFGLAVLAFKVGNLSDRELGDTYRVNARFDNIGGLNVKAPVTLAGVRIGRVSNIFIDQVEFTAVVELTISGKYNKLPSDSSASILTAGLLGSQFIGLEPGGEDRNLKEGDEITITQSAVMLEQLIGQLIFSKAEGEDK
ncbi:outer membrane lipid asymmetry maintenance protein MlaD [Pseudomonadota bacterium]